MANLVEMIAVCDILDVVTGSNSAQIPKFLGIFFFGKD
jgi:hypothetical protein